jgi:hypothetical protein
MTFSGVKVPHERRGELSHDSMVTPPFIAKTEGKGNEAGQEISLMDSSVYKNGPVN